MISMIVMMDTLWKEIEKVYIFLQNPIQHPKTHTRCDSPVTKLDLTPKICSNTDLRLLF